MGNIGKIIKDFRLSFITKENKKLSQMDLSLRIGWENPSTLSRIEKGEVKPIEKR